MCSMWLRAVFGEIPRRSPIARLDSPRASRRRTCSSRGVRPAGSSGRASTRWPAASSTAFDGLAVKPPGSRLVAQLARGALGVEAIPVRPGLAHRLINVRRRQQAACGVDPAGTEPPGVARTVEALLVQAWDPPQMGERLGPRQHPLGEIRIEADALALTRGKRTGFVPDRVRDPRRPKVMNQAGAAQAHSTSGAGQA